MNQRHPRHAFTLMELTVAVAILAGIMAMIGMIFNSAGKASGQAKSISTLYQQLRQVTEVIRRDLESIDPGTSVLAIGGVQVLGYESEKDRNSGRTLDTNLNLEQNADAHRADVLMLLASRNTDPYIFRNPPDITDPNHIDLTGVQVVYGHADIGELDATGNWKPAGQRFEGTATPGTSDLMTSQWHLARRIIAFPSKVLTTERDQSGIYPRTGPFDITYLTHQQLLDGTADVFAAPFDDLSDQLASVLPYFFRGMYHYGGPPNVFAAYYQDPTRSNRIYRYENSQWYLRGASDNKWYTPSGAAGPCLGGLEEWEHRENGAVVATDCAPSNTGPLPAYRDTFYPAAAPNRTLIDPTPPAASANRLAGHFLPGCSYFKVEYTYDDPHEMTYDSTSSPPYVENTAVRWWSVPNGEQWVWSKLSVQPSGSATERYRWPRALRITLRLKDPDGRLENAVEHAIIHAWK